MININETVIVVSSRPSSIFLSLVLRYVFRIMLNQLLILINPPPRTPPAIPITNAPTKQSSPGAFYEVPSLTISEFETEIGNLSSHIYFKADNEKVAIVEAKNTFHVNENDQNVFGFEIS